MSTVWETFTEDQFYNDLTLNLIKNLEMIPCVENICLNKKPGCEKAALLSWEQRQSCLLPQDVKNFYLSVDGFNLTYDIKYAGETLPAGRLNINSLSDLRRYPGCAHDSSSDAMPSLRDLDIISAHSEKPSFGPHYKIFELDYNDGVSSICLVYNDLCNTQEIWMLDRSLEWHRLADNFSQYFRMMLYHHGLPDWQLLHSPINLSPVSQQLILAVAPHLIFPDPVKKSICRNVENQIDPNLFKIKHKPSRKGKEKKKYSK